MIKLPAELIKTKLNVLLVGVGGTGSIVLSMLAQMHHLLNSLDNETGLRVTAYDGDLVSETNIGRQNFWSHDLHKPKASTLIDRLNMGFGLGWTAVDKQFGDEEFEYAFRYKRVDVVLTCVDAIKTRIDIGEKARELETDAIWIDVGNDANSGQVITGHLGVPSNQEKKANWFDMVGERMRNVPESNTDSCSHADALRKQDFGINHLSATNMTQALWQYVRYGKTVNAYQSYDIKAGIAQSMPMNERTYSSFGLTTQ